MTPPPRPNLRLTLPPVLVPGDVLTLFGMTHETLRRHDKELKPFRTIGGPSGRGHRRYHRDVVVDAYDARQERRP